MKSIHMIVPSISVVWVLSLIAGCGGQAGAPAKGDPKTVSPKTDEHSHGSDPHSGHAAAATLMIQSDPAEPQAGMSAALKLMIHDPKGAMVKDFEVVHEQRVHLIIVRDTMDQFAHVHPEVDASGNMTISYTFPTGGTYRLYVDHKPAGQSQATATGQVKVIGDSPPAFSLTPNVPGKVEGDGVSASISVQGGKAGSTTTIEFALADETGKSVADLQSYMGAMGHLVVISDDGKQFVHAHPAEGKAATATIAFEAHFLKSGIYKGWGQFRRRDRVHVVPFVVKVN